MAKQRPETGCHLMPEWVRSATRRTHLLGRAHLGSITADHPNDAAFTAKTAATLEAASTRAPIIGPTTPPTLSTTLVTTFAAAGSSGFGRAREGSPGTPVGTPS